MKKQKKQASIGWSNFTNLCESYYAKIEGEHETTFAPFVMNEVEARVEKMRPGDIHLRAQMAGVFAEGGGWIVEAAKNPRVEVAEDGMTVVVKALSPTHSKRKEMTAKVKFLRLVTDIPDLFKLGAN